MSSSHLHAAGDEDDDEEGDEDDDEEGDEDEEDEEDDDEEEEEEEEAKPVGQKRGAPEGKKPPQSAEKSQKTPAKQTPGKKEAAGSASKVAFFPARRACARLPFCRVSSSGFQRPIDAAPRTAACSWRRVRA